MIFHAKLDKKIQDVVVLRGHDTFSSSDELDSHEVMKVVYVFHLTLLGEEHLDLVDVSYVFSTNNQVVDIYDDKYLTT